MKRPSAVPFWLDRFPKSRRPAYAPFKGEADAGVVIVGGGLTGCACAASFAAAGIKVVVLEADAIGAGATAGAPGIVREDFDARFQQTAAAHGLRAARLLWQGMRRASLDFATAMRRFGVRADVAPLDFVHVVRRDADAARRLRREYQARRDAGLEHTWLTPASVSRTAAIESGGGILTRGSGIDPFRACAGLAAAAAARGARIHERSAARRVRARRKHVEVSTARGTVRADAVIVATEAPIKDLAALRRHLKPVHAYTVVTEPLPAAVRRETGSRTTALGDAADPPHVLRWIKEDRALFAGAEQPATPDRARDKILVQRAGQLMYELSMLYPAISGLQPEWAWTSEHHQTADGLPYIGPHRNFPRHLFALGQARHGAGAAWLAARILLRQYAGEPAKGDELFGFARILGDR